MSDRPGDDSNEFVAAAQDARRTVVGEFIYLLRTHKRWSLIPILLALAILGVFVTLTGTGLAPLIYTLF